MSVDVVVRVTDTSTERSLVKTADAAVERDVVAMEESLRSRLKMLPLEEVMESYPEVRELLREEGAGCEGCHLLHLANLREVFRCYRIDEENFLGKISGIDR